MWSPRLRVGETLCQRCLEVPRETSVGGRPLGWRFECERCFTADSCVIPDLDKKEWWRWNWRVKLLFLLQCSGVIPRWTARVRAAWLVPVCCADAFSRAVGCQWNLINSFSTRCRYNRLYAVWLIPQLTMLPAARRQHRSVVGSDFTTEWPERIECFHIAGDEQSH